MVYHCPGSGDLNWTGKWLICVIVIKVMIWAGHVAFVEEKSIS
jgi:hypothetical protein